VQSEYFLQLAVEKKRDYGRILSAVMGLYAAGFHLIPCFSPPHPYIVAIAIVPLTSYCIVTKEHPLRKKYKLWLYKVKV